MAVPASPCLVPLLSVYRPVVPVRDLSTKRPENFRRQHVVGNNQTILSEHRCASGTIHLRRCCDRLWRWRKRVASPVIHESFSWAISPDVVEKHLTEVLAVKGISPMLDPIAEVEHCVTRFLIDRDIWRKTNRRWRGADVTEMNGYRDLGSGPISMSRKRLTVAVESRIRVCWQEGASGCAFKVRQQPDQYCIESGVSPMALCFEYLIVTFGFLSPLPQQQQVIEDARPSWIDELFQHHIAIIHK